MFCSRCGTQVEPVDKFCKNCGARLVPSTEPVSVSENPRTPVETPRRPDAVRPGSANKARISPPREHKGIGAMIITLGIAVMVIAVSALYFGTDLLREPAKREEPGEATSGGIEPNSLSGNEATPAGKVPDNRVASAPKPPPSAGETPYNNPAPQTASKSLPSGNEAALSSKPPVKSQEPPGGSGSTPASSPSSGRISSGGTYETTRSTPVFESPSAASNVVASIPGGIRVNVVSAKGEWLEVHSKRGNPPGFIRRQDATFLGKTN